MKKRINGVWWHIFVILPTCEAKTKYDKIKKGQPGNTDIISNNKAATNQTLLIAYI